jgi:uncharacterized protein (TIGR02266 family)
MTEERRSAPRARISGARVTYESAAGDHVETDALNIGRGGLFVTAAKPLAVGKRISLDLQLEGEPGPWSGLGRVVWVRQDAAGPQRPSGMGVKLIDVEDAMVEAIDRLVLVRQTAEQAEVARAAAGPKREATILGVGMMKETAPAVPIVTVAPRERTVLGVGTAASAEGSVSADEPSPHRAPTPAHKPAATREPSGAREPSVVIDLVDSEKKAPAAAVDSAAGGDSVPPREASAPPKVSATSGVPTVVKRRRRGTWFLVLVFLLLAAAAAYLLLGTDLERPQWLTGTTTTPPSVSTTPNPQVSTTPTIVSWPTAIPTASAVPSVHASASPTPAATTTAGGHAAIANGPAPEVPESKKPAGKAPAKKPAPAEDNPY